MSKTIVFCATEDAALRMRNELAKAESDMMQKYPDYVVRITGNDTFGKDKLDYFISVGSKTPVIATTSKLLSTGADCKMTKLIVLDEWINSMTEFKQIIGRGTRIREKRWKDPFYSYGHSRCYSPFLLILIGMARLKLMKIMEKSVVPVLLDLNQIPTLTQLIHHIHQKKSPLLMKMGVVSA